MKFEQALKAMRRGEVVKRKDPGISAVRFWIENDRVMSKGPHDDSPRESTDHQFSMKSCVHLNDWVIVRKKPKAQAPRYTEDQLEPVGTEARIGDVVWPMGEEERKCWEGVERETLRANRENSTWPLRTNSGRLFSPNDNMFKTGEWRILKRPAKPLRDVFADPRVGDVIRHLGNWSKIHFDASREGRVWTIEEVTPRFVIIQTPDPVDSDMWTDAVCRSRPGWSKDGFAVISRAPEVAPS